MGNQVKKLIAIILICGVSFIFTVFVIIYPVIHTGVLKSLYEPCKWISIISMLVMLICIAIMFFKNLTRNSVFILTRVFLWCFVIIFLSYGIMAMYTLETTPPPILPPI